MDKGKLIDVIEEDYIKGKRKGKILSFVITAIVPLCLLVVVFASITGISNQYVSAKQELQSELENKQEEIVTKDELLENKNKEIEVLKIKLIEYSEASENNKSKLNYLQKPVNKLQWLSFSKEFPREFFCSPCSFIIWRLT